MFTFLSLIPKVPDDRHKTTSECQYFTDVPLRLLLSYKPTVIAVKDNSTDINATNKPEQPSQGVHDITGIPTP